MASTLAKEIAARLWCDPRVSDREMDPQLCEVIAEKIDEFAPWLWYVQNYDMEKPWRSHERKE